MDGKGLLTNKNGSSVDGIILQNGEGQILGSASLSGKIKRVSGSDLYVTKNGILTDSTAKPILFKGKAVKVGAGGQLFTIDGKPVTDAYGNAVYLNKDGEMVNSQGQLIKGSPLLGSNGVVIDSKGKFVTNGGKLTSLGNGLFKTSDGMIVTRDGKPVKINNEQMFINDEGLLVNAYMRPVYFKGRQLTLTKDGRLLDEQGNPVLDDGLSVNLSSEGLVDSSGELINPELTHNKNVDITPSRGATERLSNNRRPKDNLKVEQKIVPNNSEVSSTAIGGKIPVIDISKLTINEVDTLNQRYLKIKNSILSGVTTNEGGFKQRANHSTIIVGGAEAVESLNTKVTIGPDVVEERVDQASNNTTVIKGVKIPFRQNAGTSMYAVNTMRVNTDINTKVVFRLMGFSHEHYLYRGTVNGIISLRYDNIVLEFNQICSRKGECHAIDAIGVDTTTKEGSINGDIDKHYWYRFGGLTLATLIQGASEAVMQGGDRTEEVSITGQKIVHTGLSKDEMVIRAVGAVGEPLASVFLENVTRPYTGYLEKDEEIGIYLFKDIVAQ